MENDGIVVVGLSMCRHCGLTTDNVNREEKKTNSNIEKRAIHREHRVGKTNRLGTVGLSSVRHEREKITTLHTNVILRTPVPVPN